MEYNYFEKLELQINSASNYGFEPTLNIFKNGIIINYHKVGTRFMENILNIDKDLDHKQIQFIFLNENFESKNLNSINFEFNKKFVYPPWKMPNEKDYLKKRYKTWSTDKLFLNSQGYSNYTDFFFNNEKEIIFLIRNPIHRFFSGVVQILSYDVEESRNITLDKFGKILRENFETIMRDTHTSNYLNYYKEMIYNIKDKSKIKIIDLSHLKSDNSREFFCELRGDDKINFIYSNLRRFVNSNKDKYLEIYKLYEDFNTDESIFAQYIKEEYTVYQELKNSQYFLDLS